MKKIIIVLFFYLLTFSFGIEKKIISITNFNPYKHSKSNFILLNGHLLTSETTEVKDSYFFLHYNFETINPNIFESKLLLKSKKGIRGSALEFKSKDNLVKIKNPHHRFFLDPIDNGSYTIKCYFYFYSLIGSSNILKKQSIILDNKTKRIIPQIFLVYAKKRKIIVHLENFFRFKNKRKTIILEKSPFLITDKWYCLEILFDALNGKLTKKLNNQVIESIYVTEDSNEGSAIYYSAFDSQNKAPLILGEGVIGKIDEITFHTTAHQQTEQDPNKNISSIFISRVFKSGSNGKIQKVSFDKIDPSIIAKFEYRISDQIFSSQSTTIEWKDVPLNTSLKKIIPNYHNYAQFKISIKKKYSLLPYVIKKLDLHYEITPPPTSPFILGYKKKDGSIEISWSKSSDINIVGYYIYYKQGDFKGEKQKITIYTDPYDPNKKNSKKSIRYTLKGLKNKEFYSLAIKAFNKRKKESTYSKIIEFHTSEFAKGELIRTD